MDGDLYKLTIHYSVGATECSMDIGYRQDGGSYGVDTGTAAAVEFVSTFIPVLQAMLSSACQIDQVDFDPVTAVDELGGSAAIVSAPGLLGPLVLPSNMAAVITIPTTAPNSKHNGRQFISGMTEDSQVAGIITVPQLVLNNDWASKIFADLQPSAPEDANFQPVVISRILDGVKRVPPVGFDYKTPSASKNVRQMQSRLTTKRGLA